MLGTVQLKQSLFSEWEKVVNSCKNLTPTFFQQQFRWKIAQLFKLGKIQTVSSTNSFFHTLTSLGVKWCCHKSLKLLITLSQDNKDSKLFRYYRGLNIWTRWSIKASCTIIPITRVWCTTVSFSPKKFVLL